ncbi:hypothetical protein FKM82_006991 [Ascaphus truei]
MSRRVDDLPPDSPDSLSRIKLRGSRDQEAESPPAFASRDPPAQNKRRGGGGGPEEEHLLLLAQAEDPSSFSSADPPPHPSSSSSPPPKPQCCPSAPGCSIARCCHGAAKMAALAYNLGKREINQHFSVRNAKVLALGAVLLLSACHAVSWGYSRGDETCEYLISSGRFLGENVWQPYSCMTHKYKTRKWSIKMNNGSAESLAQYKVNMTQVAPVLEQLTDVSDVYWILQDPVHEQLLSESRKMITNERIDAYNQVAVGVLNGTSRNSKSKIKMFSVSKLISEETIMESLDGLHLPESSRDISAMVLMNAYCNKIIRPIDGSCCQPIPPLTIIQKLAACFFTLSIVGYASLTLIQRNKHRKNNKLCTDLESGEEKKPATATPVSSCPEILLVSFCKLGLIMAYFYFCDRANLFMKENKFYTHSSFFIPLIYILVLGVFYIENTRETKFLNREQTDEWKGWMQLVILIYHISGASSFLPVYMHIRVLVAAYLFQTGYGHFSYFWLKGDFGIYRISQVIFRLNFLVIVLCIVMDRPYQFYYFVPLVTFWFMVIYGSLAIWPQIIQKKANGNTCLSFCP